MRAVVQRVSTANVRVGAQEVGAIGSGLCVLLGVAAGDTEEQARRLARRIANLRIFENEDGKFDRSVLESGGAVLAVSQFTLIADTTRGNRPSFTDAARPEDAEPLYRVFCQALRAEGVEEVEQGRFGARMLVEIAGDGPVTIVLET